MLGGILMKIIYSKSYILKLISLFAVFIASFILNSVFCNADENPVIRVGCVDIDGFLELSSDNTVSGYAAEYLNKISEYTNWKYEYVKDSWENCLQMLKDGKIDLLMPAEYSTERAKYYLFSSEICCMDYTALICMKNDDRYFYEDFKSFDGMTVGIISGNYLNSSFDKYAREHNFSVNYKEYLNAASLCEALNNREVDAIVNGNMNFFPNQKLLAKINYMPAYFITNIQRKDIMDKLNYALKNIQLENPYYAADLHKSYYGKTEKQSIGFTREESDFINNTGTIKVICQKNHYPLEYYNKKTKNAEGIYIDIIKLIGEQCGINFEFIFPKDNETALDAFSAGEGQILASAVDTTTVSSLYNMNFTNKYINVPYVALKRNSSNISLTDDLNVGMLDSSQGMRAYVEKDYINWNYKEYETNSKLIKALLKGDIDIILINSYMLREIEEDNKKNDISEIISTTFFLPISLGISKDENPLLLSVLKKSILKIENSEIDSCIQNYYYNSTTKKSIINYLKENMVFTSFLFSVFVILVGLIFMLIYINTLKAKQNAVLLQKNTELLEAGKREENLIKKAQIDKLTNLYDKITTEKKCCEFMLKPNKYGALVLMDIDNFKEINDTFGHKTGDKYIIRISEIIHSICRDDDIAGRIGGDEFLVLFDGLNDREILKTRLTEFFNKIKEDKELSEKNVTCSIGALFISDKDTDFYDLYSRADSAMYSIKKSGKNNFTIL